MSEVATGIIVGNTIQLDAPLGLPDQTLVTITVQPLTAPKPEALAAWERLKKSLEEHPIHGGGKRYTRDELHERS